MIECIPQFQGRVIEVNKETATAPDGHPMTLEVVRHPGGAGVLAIDDKQRVCLIRQFRHAAGGWIWEVPAGRRDHGEDPLHTAQRELQEEVGITATDWQKLGAIWSTPGFCDEVIHVYLARQLTETQTARERHEFMEVHWPAWDKAVDMISKQEVSDSKTLACLFYARAFL